MLLPLVACGGGAGSDATVDDAARESSLTESGLSEGSSPRDAAGDSGLDSASVDALAPEAAAEASSPDAFSLAAVPSTLGSFTTQGTAGCGAAGMPTGVRTLTLTVGGAARTATVFVPPDYDPRRAYPLVFVFHGDGGTGAGIRGSFGLEAPAAGRALFAYPDGAGHSWDSTLRGTNRDMELVFAVRDALHAQYCVDARRTFATGHSRGGFFVNQLACRYGAAEFAAIAPHSGTIDPESNSAYVYGPPNPMGGPFLENGDWDFFCPSDSPSGSAPARPALPPPAMVLHGACDAVGGVEFAQGRRTAQHWGFAARCSTTPSVVSNATPGCSPATSCPTTANEPCYSAPGCASGHEVVFCAIPGMGHALWCHAAERVWGFFQTH